MGVKRFLKQSRRDKAINSLLCVGLDLDTKIPERYQSEDRPILKFCFDVIDATKDVASCYKPQFAHFAAANALDDLKEVMQALKSEGLPVILDAKRETLAVPVLRQRGVWRV